MSQMSDYLEGALLNHLFRATGLTAPTTLHIAACTAAPTDASTGTTIVEPVGNGYTRLSVTCSTGNWTAPGAGGTIDNTGVLSWPVASGSWGTITHIAICDAATLGNVLFYGSIVTSKPVSNGDTLKIAIGDLDITLA